MKSKRKILQLLDNSVLIHLWWVSVFLPMISYFLYKYSLLCVGSVTWHKIMTRKSM
jgi:hypothetical protein